MSITLIPHSIIVKRTCVLTRTVVNTIQHKYPSLLVYFSCQTRKMSKDWQELNKKSDNFTRHFSIILVNNLLSSPNTFHIILHLFARLVCFFFTRISLSFTRKLVYFYNLVAFLLVFSTKMTNITKQQYTLCQQEKLLSFFCNSANQQQWAHM